MTREEAKEILLGMNIVDRHTYLEAISFAVNEFCGERKTPTMTPRRAADILRNANLVGELRLAADAGIEALEKMGGAYEAN